MKNLKQLQAILTALSVIDDVENNQINNQTSNQIYTNSLNRQIGEKVIVRTYSAGVWFGTLDQKAGEEVILTNARRMWFFKCEKSISLSGAALYGVTDKESKICPPVAQVWLEAIEIISMTEKAINSIESAKYVEAE